MKTESILKEAEAIYCRCGRTGPEELCRLNGVILLYYPMGKTEEACKGFVLRCGSKTSITINSDMSPFLQKTVLWHELGHYFLHIQTGLADGLREFSVWNVSDKMEREANLLAAELSIKDEDVTEVFSETKDFFEASGKLNVLPGFLDFKIRMMNASGAALPGVPVPAEGSFLGKQKDEDAYVQP